MGKLKQTFKRIRDQLVIDQVWHAKLPEFSPDRVCRYRIIFSGRVQKVGFRLEVQELAKRLNLTGFCENLPNGTVLAELQGPENRIRFLVSFLESLIRIKITGKTMEELPLREQETGFERK